MHTVDLAVLQAMGKAFARPEQLLQAVDLYNLTQQSFREEVEVRCCPCEAVVACKNMGIFALHVR